MKMFAAILLCTLGLTLACAYAEPDAQPEISALMARIALLEERLARLEAGQVVESVNLEEQEVASSPTLQVEVPAWTQRLRIGGDMRYRHEMIDDAAAELRHRHRIRARINATATLNEDLKVRFGLSSGGSANDSGNQSLDQGFSRKAIGLDLAHFDWRLSESLQFSGGKMSNPFFRPGSFHLLFDGDIRPEGLALKMNSRSVFANASAFWVEERGSGPDTIWYGLQAGYQSPETREVVFTAGASYHEFSESKGRTPIFTPTSGQGNQLDANGNYLYGFSIVEVFADIKIDLSGRPLRLFADYVTNRDADEYSDGFAIGMDYRGKSDMGSWNLGYVYEDIEANAVVGAFTDSDFAGGTSDGKGHSLLAGYKFTRDWSLGLRYIIGDRGEAAGRERDYNRLQADIKFSY